MEGKRVRKERKETASQATPRVCGSGGSAPAAWASGRGWLTGRLSSGALPPGPPGPLNWPAAGAGREQRHWYWKRGTRRIRRQDRRGGLWSEAWAPRSMERVRGSQAGSGMPARGESEEKGSQAGRGLCGWWDGPDVSGLSAQSPRVFRKPPRITTHLVGLQQLVSSGSGRFGAASRA